MAISREKLTVGFDIVDIGRCQDMIEALPTKGSSISMNNWRERSVIQVQQVTRNLPTGVLMCYFLERVSCSNIFQASEVSILIDRGFKNARKRLLSESVQNMKRCKTHTMYESNLTGPAADAITLLDGEGLGNPGVIEAISSREHRRSVMEFTVRYVVA